MYATRLSVGLVDLAFTDRHGGVSQAPFDELNLALASADDAGSVAHNHQRLLDDFAPGARLADLNQVHGAEAVVVDDAGRHEGDGLVTTTPDLVLLARAADCVPVLLADPDAGVVGAAHAGRPGVLAGVVAVTVESMRKQGASRITGWIGPHVCGHCYEVPADLQEEVAGVVAETRSTTSWGTPALDLGAGVRSQLEEAGVDVVDVARCTVESADLYSYRRDGDRSGRHGGLIRIRQ